MDKYSIFKKYNIIYYFITIMVILLTFCFDEGPTVITEGNVTDGISAEKNGISFQEHAQGNNYGFDAIQDKKDAYISIKTEGSNQFNVIVRNHPNGATAASFNTAFLEIVGSDSVGKYFLGNDATTALTITSSTSSGDVTVDIEGCTGELAHNDDCYVLENQLYVKIYEEKTRDYFYFYLLNNANFNTYGLKDYMNSVLKQAVYGIINLSEGELPYFDKTQYDKNNNGCLDLWVDKPVPSDDEMEEIKMATENLVWSNDIPGIAVIDDNIKTHWSLKNEIPISGMSRIELKEAAYIEIGYTLYIGPLPGGQGDGESFYIYGKQGNTLNVQKGEFDTAPLSYPHPLEHTVQSTTYGLKGKAAEGTNFAVLSENTDQYIVTHEFLHLKTPGMLHHVTDSTNIMYPDVNIKNTRLRYRELPILEGGTEGQWSEIQGAYF